MADARGCLFGLAVADALGAPLEFSEPATAADAVRLGLEMTGGGGWEPGEWTDDTAMALALGESIAEHGLFNVEDAAQRYIAWADSGPKDIGIITRVSLGGSTGAEHSRSRAISYFEETGKAAGNGTIMRAAPIGLAAGTAAEAREAAMQDAALTHGDPAAGMASAALCAALLAIRDRHDPLQAAAAEVDGHKELTEAVEAGRNGDEEYVRRNAGGTLSGVCWTTLAVGLYALSSYDRYEDAVLFAIGLGGDTDTNAAVTGALVGGRDGVESIPDRWLQALRERERIERVAERLAALA